MSHTKPLPELTDDQIAELSIEFCAMEPLSDFDYVGFGRKCYDLGARSTAAQPAAEQEPVVPVSVLSGMVEPLEGVDSGQPGYHWRRGWNDALRRAMDYARPPPAAAQPVEQPSTMHDTTGTQALWPQMIAALAAIDAELGLPEDGCNSLTQTLAAIRKLKAAPPAASGDSTPPSEPVYHLSGAEQGAMKQALKRSVRFIDKGGALQPDPEAADHERGALE